MTLDLSPDELLSTTRAVRKRLDLTRPVERDVLEECLHLAQQALSASIKRLEDQLGVALFVRNTRHVELTSAGEVLVDGARAVIAAASEALERVHLVTAGLGAAVGALALVPVGSAAAHDYVVSSTPAAGSTVDSSPATVSITFNDVILDLSGTGSSNVLEVTDAAGLHYEDGCSTTSGPTLTTGVALGSPGAYTMTYQAVSADGHTVSDAVPFTYAPAAGTAERGPAPRALV